MIIANAISLRKYLLPSSMFKNLYKARICHQRTQECSDKPIKYSASKAANWKAEYTRRGTSDDSPWFQTYAISGSLAVFLIYFCILREENDIDELLSIPNYDRIEGLESAELQRALEYNEERALQTGSIKVESTSN